MLSLKKVNQTGGVYHMYIKPEFEIIEVSEEDIIQTSLELGDKVGGDTIDLGGLGSFEWF
ncbi:MAG: hypothetical protein IKU25_03235 [Clostridia bacterium]|nr:hypothetical protein [Clostridia bacterium]